MARLQDPNEWASSFSAVGFSKFYRKRAVKRQRVSQPILMGPEGKKQGFYGFGADLYCPYCDGVFDFVLLEFASSEAGTSVAWGEIDLDEFGVDLMKCPKCGNRELMIEII